MQIRRAAALVLLVSGPAFGATRYLPGVANTGGANGTRFQSAVSILNPGSSEAGFEIGFIPAPGVAAPAAAVMWVGAGATLSFSNALSELFALDGTFGTLTVTADVPFEVRGSTSNVASSGGTYGLGLVSVGDESILRAGEVGHATWLAQGADPSRFSRTNVTVVVIAAPAAVDVEVWDASGVRRGGTTVTADVPTTWQASGASLLGGTELSLGRVSFRVREGAATGYTSVVDNVTGDGIAALAERVPTGEADLLLLGAANAHGQNGTYWTTDVRLFNPGAAALVATLETLGIAPAPVPISRAIPAGSLVEIADVLGAGGFHLADGAAGALRIRAGGALVIGARTGTPSPRGGGAAFSAAQRALRTWGDVVDAGRTATLLGAARSGFHTNVALLGGPAGASGALVARDATGQAMARASFTLAPWQWQQQASSDWFTPATLPNGSRVDVEVASGSASAYATVIDDTTGDPLVVSTAPLPRACDGVPTPAAPDQSFTLGETSGWLRPLLGVNIGPVPSGTPGNADLTGVYREAWVTTIRTHDYYGPLDMATMYPDQSRDPSSPASYRFTESDTVYRAILAGGFEPYLRIGDSWSNGAGYPAASPRHPTNPANWVRAAVEVVRHYQDAALWGKQPLRYVEIWNEPDGSRFWDADRGSFYDLFAKAAIALKAAFPELKVGGPGLTPAGFLSPQGRAFTTGFLDYLKQNAVPLDFLSWHVYSSTPSDFADGAIYYRQELDARGYVATESHLSEWNTQLPSDPVEARAVRLGGKGAAILTAGWIGLQEQGVASASFYRGPDPDINAPTFYGLFYADGRPKRNALAFSLWAKTARHPDRLEVHSETAASSAPLSALAGRAPDGEVALLVANPTSQPSTYKVSMADGRAASCLTVEEVSDASEAISLRAVVGDTVSIAAYATQLVTFQP